MNKQITGEVAWNALFICAILAIIGFGSWAYFESKRSNRIDASGQQNLSSMIDATQKTEALSKTEAGQVKSRTWDLSAEALGSTILTNLTEMADGKHVQLDGFTAGKPLQVAQLQEVPFTLSLNGAFMDVMDVIRGVEDPQSKLALKLLHIASDQETDRVTATVTVVGFQWGGAK